MGVFKDEKEIKRVIFNVDVTLAERLERAKTAARTLGRKLDVDGAVDKALEKFLKKAEKRLQELRAAERAEERLLAADEAAAGVGENVLDEEFSDADAAGETSSAVRAPGAGSGREPDGDGGPGRAAARGSAASGSAARGKATAGAAAAGENNTR
ncbi:MAG: hypothetical protein H0S85_00900 [Desulfovibrionaceae bacterium]|jgi:hypothetical protein|nr:hypothetical protein [Desulfovibrionaceae bacterium]